MELLGYLRFPAQNPIGCNANLRTHFQQDALPRIPWLPFTFVDINDLRMRINLQHRGCFPLAAVGVKMLIYWIFGAPYCTCSSTDRIPDGAGIFVWMGSTNVPNFSLIGWTADELLGAKWYNNHSICTFSRDKLLRSVKQAGSNKDGSYEQLLFVCVEVLRPRQPNGVMSSADSSHNHTFIWQA